MDLQGIDPSKLLNPVPEKTIKPIVKEEGPVAQTYIADYPDDEKENLVSPQEALAHLISKPIIHDDPYDPPSPNHGHHHLTNKKSENFLQVTQQTNKLKEFILHNRRLQNERLDRKRIHERVTNDHSEHNENQPEESQQENAKMKNYIVNRQVDNRGNERGRERGGEGEVGMHHHYREEKEEENARSRNLHENDVEEEDGHEGTSEDVHRHLISDVEEREREREEENEREGEQGQHQERERNDEDGREGKDNKKSGIPHAESLVPCPTPFKRSSIKQSWEKSKKPVTNDPKHSKGILKDPSDTNPMRRAASCHHTFHQTNISTGTKEPVTRNMCLHDGAHRHSNMKTSRGKIYRRHPKITFVRKRRLTPVHERHKLSTTSNETKDSASRVHRTLAKKSKAKYTNKKAVKRWSHSTEHNSGMLEENVANELEEYGHPSVMTIGTHSPSDEHKVWTNMHSPGNGYYVGNGVGPARSMLGEYLHYSSHYEGPQGSPSTHENADGSYLEKGHEGIGDGNAVMSEEHGLFGEGGGGGAGGGRHEDGDNPIHSLEISDARADHETAGIIDAIWEHDYEEQHDGKDEGMHIGRGRHHGNSPKGVLKFFGHGGDNGALLPSERLEGFAGNHWGHGHHAGHWNGGLPQAFVNNHEGLFVDYYLPLYIYIIL